MAKINMTEMLGTKLKELRIKKGVKSKDVALHIGKSAAYLTKLEKGEIKQLEQDVLIKIIHYITGDSEGFNKFIENVAISSDDDTLQEDEWFMNFDLIERKIPIPKTLIEYINLQMELLHISIHDLTSFINRNEDLNSAFFKSIDVKLDDLDKNTWYMRKEILDEQNVKEHWFVIVSYTEDEIESILQSKSDVCNHTTMFAILYHIQKMKYKQEANTLNIYDIQDEVESLLKKHKFCSLGYRSKLIRQARTQEEFENLLSEFDRNNQKIITNILAHFSFMSDFDIKYTNAKLEKVLENLDNDRSFALSFMAIPLIDMKHISVLKKKKFLEEIGELIKKFVIDDGETMELY